MGRLPHGQPVYTEEFHIKIKTAGMRIDEESIKSLLQQRYKVEKVHKVRPEKVDHIAQEGRRRAASKAERMTAEPDPEKADALNNHGQPEVEEDTCFGNHVLYAYQAGKLIDHEVRTPNMSGQEWQQKRAAFYQRYEPTHPDFN